MDPIIALDVNSVHSTLIMQTNVYMLQLLHTTRDLIFNPAIEAKARLLFPVSYVVKFLECRKFYLVSKSLLLQLNSMRGNLFDPIILECAIIILGKIYRFTDFCEGDNERLLNDRWKHSFYYFTINGMVRVLEIHLRTYTRDYDNRLISLVESASISRSSIAVMADTIRGSIVRTPLHQIPEVPSMKTFQSIGIIIDILMACNMLLWKSLGSDRDSLQILIWISVASKYMMDFSPSLQDTKLRGKIESFLSQVATAYQANLIQGFRNTFLNNGGIKSYMQEVSGYLHKRLTGTKHFQSLNAMNSYEIFVKHMRFPFGASDKAIRNSAVFKVLTTASASACKYLSSGGNGTEIVAEEDEEPINDGDSDGADAITPFESLSDFEIWRSNGGRLLSLLAEFLIEFDYEPLNLEADISVEEYQLVPATILSTLITQLDFKESSDELMKLKESKKRMLWALQDAYKDFGIRSMVIKLLNKAMNSSYNSPMFNIVPLVLRLGAFMMGEGNVNLQNSFMVPLPNNQAGFVYPLRHILRECNSIYSNTTRDSLRKVDLKMLRIINEVMAFCRAFCGGHNQKARLFLKSQESLNSKVDLVFDIAEGVNLLGSILDQTYIRYIEYEFFVEKLAPLVWDDGSGDKRKCIAWHDQSINYLEVSQLLHTLGNGFKCLKDIVQGPCYENQQPAMKVAGILRVVLEYCGVMHITSSTKLPTKTILGNSFRIVRFDLGDPRSFLRTYRDELTKYGKSYEEPIWRESVDLSKQTFEGLINVEIELLRRVSKEVELKCVQFILALMEGTSSAVVNEMSEKLNFSLMFQNMDNDFVFIRKSSFFRGFDPYYGLRKEAAMGYLSLISSLFSAAGLSTSMLSSWIDRCKRKGLDISSYNASVEIIGKKGDIQQIYFPIPVYISMYWSYPEVQKAKEYVVQNNDRDSPEEKINDFRSNIDLLLSIMARQKYLRYTMTPFLHAIFGGKPVAPQWVLLVIPRQRVMVLWLSLFLNVYYMYITYRERYPGYPGFDQYFTYVYDALNHEYTDNGTGIHFASFKLIEVLAWIHFSLNASIYFRQLINSTAADENISDEDDSDDSNLALKVARAVGNFFFGMFLILTSEWWAAAVTAFSILAIFVSQWFYVPCLLEVVPQFPLMRFLVEAVERNVVKIGFTILLALLLLYFYATIAYLSFPNQYNINGYMDCGDLLTCFKTHIDYGLNNPPDWNYGSYVKPDLAGWFSTSPWGFLISSVLGSFFVISYVILINLVLQSVISGVIIDTFGSMREEAEAIEADIRGGCFICSISRDEFESNGIDYNVHIKDEHNMWKYVWLKYYLLEKDPLLFTGPEHYAFEQMKEKATFLKLFPVKRSLSLDRQKARAKAAEQAIELSAVYDAIKILEEGHRDLKKALAGIKRAQDTQAEATEELQMKFAKLQLLNSQALEGSLKIQGEFKVDAGSSAMLHAAEEEDKGEEDT